NSADLAQPCHRVMDVAWSDVARRVVARPPAPPMKPIHTVATLSGTASAPGKFSDPAPIAERPDARILVRNEDGAEVAHAALWWNDVPPFKDESPGAIGGFAADDEAAAHVALNAAAAHLRAQGRTIAIGPMN